MSRFRKPSTKKIGAKVLVMGDTGVGKTIFTMSFPKIFAMDSETGIAFYEGKEEGKNLLAIANTQDFNELSEAIDEVSEIFEEDPNSIGTLAIDSETKFYQNLTDTVLTVEEKKAKKAGRDIMDSNISVRGWGRIKSVATRLQNLKIDLSAKGVNVISVAQSEDVKQKVGDNFIKVGEKPAMAKGSAFDYDIVIRLFVEKDARGEYSYKGEILKDRTKVCKVGEIVDNPSYLIWKKSLEERKGDLIDSNLAKDAEKAMKKLEEEDAKAEKTVADKLKEVMGRSDEAKNKALELIKKHKIVNPLSPKDAKELKKIEDIVNEVEEFLAKSED